MAADSRTSRLADGIRVETFGRVVVLRGTVDDLEDGDLLVEVASAVAGVIDVRDETDVEGL
jgi:osmotically-inducible protein OsmY